MLGGSWCGAWSGEECCAEGGEGVRCTPRFFDRAEGLKKPHLGQTYSVQEIVKQTAHHNHSRELTRILPYIFFHKTVVGETFLTDECIA